VRLNRFLASCGAASSRRKAETLVAEGRVAINGHVADSPAVDVDTEKDYVRVDGKVIHLITRHSYLMLNKPEGVITTLSDPQDRTTVVDILPPKWKRKKHLFPVGRLDYNTQGLLLLTTDGELAHALSHPKSVINKIYKVKVKGMPEAKSLEKLRKGMRLDGRLARMDVVKIIPSPKSRHVLLEVHMHQGRRRQIREMCFRIGHPVLRLRRVAYGPLRLGKLAAGHVRELTAGEIQTLKEAVS